MNDVELTRCFLAHGADPNASTSEPFLWIKKLWQPTSPWMTFEWMYCSAIAAWTGHLSKTDYQCTAMRSPERTILSPIVRVVGQRQVGQQRAGGLTLEHKPSRHILIPWMFPVVR